MTPERFARLMQNTVGSRHCSDPDCAACAYYRLAPDERARLDPDPAYLALNLPSPTWGQRFGQALARARRERAQGLLAETIKDGERALELLTQDRSAGGAA